MEDKAKKYRLLLNQYLESVNVVMSKLYDDMEFQLITAVSSFPLSQLEKGFPITLQKRINTIINKLNKKSTKVIAAGARTSWTLSNTKNDEFVNNYFKNKQKPANWQQKYCKANEGALNAFLKRKTNGLDLSERIWNYNGQYIDELETALQIAIGNGVPANELSKYLTKYLNNTSATILAVDKNGIAKKQPIKPGRGVYREPKKNAMRLARTEINMSYDTADWTRYQQLDFVVGFEVHLSGNHTVKRGKRYVKLVDICDRLAGKYPKSFKFTGWHPNCRCYVTSILKSQEEQDKEDLARLRGETPDEQPSENTVTEPPKGFDEWVKENTKSLQKSHSLPYFVRDNQQYFEDINFSKTAQNQFKEVEKQLTKEERRTLTLQKAKERQAARTEDEIKDIQARWKERHDNMATIKYAHKVSEIVKGFKGLETDIQSIESAISAKDYRRLETVLNNVKRQYKQYKALTNLDNPLQYAKDYTLSELKSVNAAVDKTINDWLKHYSYATFDKAPLEHKINKLDKEIIDIETSKKYNTWKVAQDAYKKLLTPLKVEKDWISIKNKVSSLKAYKTKSKIYNNLLIDIEKDITNKVDRSLIKQKLVTAENKKNELERTTKKRKSQSTSKLYVNEQGNTEVQKSEIPLQNTEQDKLDIIKQKAKVDERTAKKYNAAIHGFTYQWDYEIRQVQMGNTVKSRHGHSYNSIVEKSVNCERFITDMPKWNGGVTYRGMTLSENDLKQLIEDGKKGKINNLGTASWSTEKNVSDNFSGYHYGELNEKGEMRDQKVVLICKQQARGTSIRFLSEYQGEHEILCSMFSRYTYVTDYKKGNITYIEVTSHIEQ